MTSGHYPFTAERQRFLTGVALLLIGSWLTAGTTAGKQVGAGKPAGKRRPFISGFLAPPLANAIYGARDRRLPHTHHTHLTPPPLMRRPVRVQPEWQLRAVPVLRVHAVQRHRGLFARLLWSVLPASGLLEGRGTAGTARRRSGPGPGVRGLCRGRGLLAKGRRELHGQMGSGECVSYLFTPLTPPLHLPPNRRVACPRRRVCFRPDTHDHGAVGGSVSGKI